MILGVDGTLPLQVFWRATSNVGAPPICHDIPVVVVLAFDKPGFLDYTWGRWLPIHVSCQRKGGANHASTRQPTEELYSPERKAFPVFIPEVIPSG